MCAHSCGGQRLTKGVFNHSPHFLKQAWYHFLFMGMHECNTQEGQKRESDSDQLPDMGAGTQPPVLCKSHMCSWLTSHLYNPSLTFETGSLFTWKIADSARLADHWAPAFTQSISKVFFKFPMLILFCLFCPSWLFLWAFRSFLYFPHSSAFINYNFPVRLFPSPSGIYHSIHTYKDVDITSQGKVLPCVFPFSQQLWRF